MEAYKMSAEEKAFLQDYNIEEFERPSIATDVAIFSILQEEQGPSRKLPKQELKVVLIQRASYPYKECWALPGGFCRPGEDVIETARRELREETNVEHAYLRLAGVYGEKDRDPRGWIISNTYLALIDASECKLRAGTDAWKALWFTVELQKTELERKTSQDKVKLVNQYELHLYNELENVSLCAVIQEDKEFSHYHETVRYEITACDGIAFDHASILLQTLLSLRQQVEDNLCVAFDLMPEKFTLTQLQTGFELILDRKLLTPNFRRKISEYVAETEEIIEGEMHRPAKLYKRNAAAFYK